MEVISYLLTSWWTTVTVWTVVGIYFYRSRKLRSRPKPSSPQEIPELREECLEILRKRYELIPEWYESNATFVSKQEEVENLRFYRRFIDRYSAVHLDALVSALRYSRIRKVTKLQSADITEEQMAFHEQLSAALHRSGARGVEDLSFPVFYALDHMDDAPLILSLVEERGLHTLGDIKAMLKDMKNDQGSPALAEGML